MRYLRRMCLWVVIGLLGLLLCMTTINWVAYLRTGHWTRVQAELKRVEITDYDQQPLTLQHDEQWDGRGHLFVAFTYAVDGRVYEGGEVGFEIFEDKSTTIRRFKQLRHVHESGLDLQAWVDPTDPSRSFVFRETNLGMYLYPALAGVFFIAVWIDCRRRRPAPIGGWPGWRFGDPPDHAV